METPPITTATMRSIDRRVMASTDHLRLVVFRGPCLDQVVDVPLRCSPRVTHGGLPTPVVRGLPCSPRPQQPQVPAPPPRLCPSHALNQTTQYWHTGSSRKRAVAAYANRQVYESH